MHEYHPCIWPTSVDDSIILVVGAHPKFFFPLLFVFLVGLFAMSHCELDHQFFIKKSESLDIPLRGSFHSQNIVEVLHLYTLWEFNFGQRLWDKVCCYWEHLGKPIGNLGMHWKFDVNKLKTWWEFDGNSLRNTLTTWEHIGNASGIWYEHVENLMGTAWGTHWQLGNIWGMHWEFYVNT